MDTPQPPPVRQGRPVTDALIQWIDIAFMFDRKIADRLKDLIEARNRYGIQKYGQPLMIEDGRDDVIDAMQEAGDLIQYAYKGVMNGRQNEIAEELYPCFLTLQKMLFPQFKEMRSPYRN